jgi:hypothetical protein
MPTTRPAPNTPEESIYRQLLAQMSRAGRQVDFDACMNLATDIQQYGHRAGRVKHAAEAMGLDPKWLPRQRTW